MKSLPETPKTGRPKTVIPKLGLNSMSAAFGVSKEKMRQALNKAGIPYGKGILLTIGDCYRALAGDVDKVNLQLKQVELRRLKREEREAEEKLITVEDSCQFINDSFRPLRDLIVHKLPTLAPLLNPADPSHALAHLNRFTEEFLKRGVKTPSCKVAK